MNYQCQSLIFFVVKLIILLMSFLDVKVLFIRQDFEVPLLYFSYLNFNFQLLITDHLVMMFPFFFRVSFFLFFFYHYMVIILQNVFLWLNHVGFPYSQFHDHLNFHQSSQQYLFQAIKHSLNYFQLDFKIHHLNYFLLFSEQ